MTTRTGGQILVDQLKIQGCDRIFTVPGESFLAIHERWIGPHAERAVAMLAKLKHDLEKSS